ncbi:MAG: hypothetical protein ACFFB5_04460 [Promethearchaeota archaeon]
MSLYQIRSLKTIISKVIDVCDKYSKEDLAGLDLIKMKTFLENILNTEHRLITTDAKTYKKHYKKVIEGFIPK